MDKIFKEVLIVVITGIFVAGTILAATFPGALNSFSTGDIIEAIDWNAIEATIGITSSASTTSLTYKVNIRPTYAYASSTYLQIDYASTTYLQISYASTTYFQLSGGVVTASSTYLGDLTIDGDLIFNDEIKPDGATCSVNQILRKIGADDWDCVDERTGAISEYFLTTTSDPISGLYRMQLTNTGEAEGSIASSTLGLGDDQLLFSFITPSGEALTDTLEIGIYSMHSHFERTGGNRSTTLYWTLTASSTNETQTLIMTSEDSGAVTSKASFTTHASLTSDYEFSTGDRLILKIYGDLGAGAATEITIYTEGTLGSRVTILTTSEVLSSIFLRQDGSTPLTANWDAGSYTVTAATFIGNLTGKASNLSVTSQATGSIVYYSGEASDQWTHLAIGSAGQVLEVSASGIPEWDTDDGTGDVTAVGDCATGDCFDGTSDGGTYLDFYDAQGATRLIGGDNSSSITLTLPTATGTVLTQEAIDTSAELLAIVGDETGTGSLVFANNPTMLDITLTYGIAGATSTWSGLITASGGLTGTGTWNLGGAVVEITNSASVQVSTAGHIGIDTTSGQVRYSDGTATRTLSYIKPFSFDLENPVSGDEVTLWKVPYDITLTQVDCLVDPTVAGTAIDIDIFESDANGDSTTTVFALSLTCGNTNSATTTFANATIDANDWMGIFASNASGTVSWLSVTGLYGIDPD